jgi:hypothetical protein
MGACLGENKNIPGYAESQPGRAIHRKISLKLSHLDAPAKF